MATLDETEVDIPNSFLSKGQTYWFQLLLGNFLGTSTNSSEWKVTVATGSIPSLLITAGTSYSMLVPNALAVFAQVRVLPSVSRTPRSPPP